MFKPTTADISTNVTTIIITWTKAISQIRNCYYHPGGHLLYDVNRAASPEEGSKIIQSTLLDGAALKRFQTMLVTQGVDPELAETLVQDEYNHRTDPVLLPSNYVTELTCSKTGKTSTIGAR
jgi:thymidine phosphorylase